MSPQESARHHQLSLVSEGQRSLAGEGLASSLKPRASLTSSSLPGRPARARPIAAQLHAVASARLHPARSADEISRRASRPTTAVVPARARPDRERHGKCEAARQAHADCPNAAGRHIPDGKTRKGAQPFRHSRATQSDKIRPSVCCLALPASRTQRQKRASVGVKPYTSWMTITFLMREGGGLSRVGGGVEQPRSPSRNFATRSTTRQL